MVLLGCSLVPNLVCVPLKLPFEKLIFRMRFGRANRAPVGRVQLPCREGYEKRQDCGFQPQVQGEEKKNHRLAHIHKYLEVLLCTAGVQQALSMLHPKTLVLFLPCATFQGTHNLCPSN